MVHGDPPLHVTVTANWRPPPSGGVTWAPATRYFGRRRGRARTKDMYKQALMTMWKNEQEVTVEHQY
jgi:hypothetical protein